MRFNMTFKSRLLVCVLLFIFSLSLFPLYAQETGSALRDADILLVHNAAASEAEEESIHVLVDILTYLRYSVTFCTPDECKDRLSDYPTLILYNLKDSDTEFLDAVANSHSRSMIIGGELMAQYLVRTGQSGRIVRTVSGPATVNYTLYETQPLEGLAAVEEMPVITEPDFVSGSLTVGTDSYPLFAGLGRVLFLPVADITGEVMQLAFTQELVNWMWVYNDTPPSYAQYYVLDDAYPFTDLGHLKAVIDAFTDAHLPFVISVMPVYQNGEYPAMKRFCEVLRYAQANGGAVILHAPFIQKTAPTDEELSNHLTTALEAYSNYGVYPLGIQAPEQWMYDSFYLNILARYKTVFIYRDDAQKDSFDLSIQYNPIYASGHQLVAPATEHTPRGASPLKAYSSAVYLNLSDSLEEIKAQIARGKESYVPFKSLWSMPHAVYANDYYMSYDAKQLTFNGEVKDLTYKPFEYEPFNYHRNVLARITMDLQRGNQGAIAFVLIALVIFCVFILVARHRNKKEFFMDDE